VLRLVCSCLQNAPASDTWDLSSLLVNGSPVSQATVEAVLSVIYSSMGALHYEMDRSAGLYSLSQLLDMLLFADAVGCSKAVLAQLAGQLGSTARAELEVTLTADGSSVEATSTQGRGGGRGGGRAGRGRGGRSGRAAAGAADTAASVLTLRLELEGMYSIQDVDEEGGDDDDDDDAKDTPFVLKRWCSNKDTVVCHLSEQQEQQLQHQVSQQLEGLLFVGFKLDLQQLLQPALSFLRAHVSLLDSIIPDQADTIFTQRVLAAAGGTTGAELLTRACLQRPLGLGFGIDSMFGDIEVIASDVNYAFNFEGTLLQELDDFRKGTRLLVYFSRRGQLVMRTASADAGSDLEGETTESRYWFGVVLGPKHTFKNSHAQGSA
jgi:hypothetical protein